jgi:uncharacterized membrane protein
MDILLDNLPWMSWNVFLAMLGWLFALYFSRATKPIFKAWWAGLWFLFLPNTVYLLTDLKHLFSQWNRVGEWGQSLLLLQFGVLSLIGVYTYVKGIEQFEKGLIAALKQSRYYSNRISMLFMRYPNRFFVGFNFLVSFGVIMGRVMRTNSWHVFTQPMRVVQDGVAVLTSAELLFFTLGFGLVVNAVWLVAKQMQKS